jgi:hypothetical protein
VVQSFGLRFGDGVEPYFAIHGVFSASAAWLTWINMNNDMSHPEFLSGSKQKKSRDVKQKIR